MTLTDPRTGKPIRTRWAWLRAVVRGRRLARNAPTADGEALQRAISNRAVLVPQVGTQLAVSEEGV
jgi:hypothetical protein